MGKKISIKWHGAQYSGDTWNKVLKDVVADPRVDSWEQVMLRLSEIYGIDADASRTFDDVAHELAELGIIEIVVEDTGV